MKNRFLKKAVFPVVAIFALLYLVSSSSCKKETDCTAIITVLDTVGAPLSGAKIRLYSSLPKANLQDQTLTSDSKGEATFVFKYEAILDIEVIHDSLGVAEGVVKLVEGETVREKVQYN